MLFSLEDLTTPLTRQQVQASIYDVLGIVGTNTTSWKSGAVVRTMIVGVSVVLAVCSELMADIAKSGFLELAEGAWLALVARYVYGVDKILADFAEGEVTLINTGGGIYTMDPDDLVVINPTTSKAYRNTSGFTLNAMSTITVPIRAIEAGSASTVLAGSITEIETTLLNVTCSNAAALVGSDEEPDQELRLRCAEKRGALSPMGPSDAYASAVRNSPRADGTLIGVNRVLVIKDGYGNVTTYVATASGALTGDEDDPTTDLGAVNERIQQLAAPLAVTANTISATERAIDVTCQIWIYNTSGLTDPQLIELLGKRLDTYLSSQPIGGNVIGGDPGKVFADALRTGIGTLRPEVFHVVVSLPAADIELLQNEVPVLGTLTPTIHQVPPKAGL